MALIYSLEDLQKPSASSLFTGTFSPQGCLAGNLLLHGEWDRAHETAQELSTPEGSFWHGIVHRREPDPGNAAYWFRRTGSHPVFPALREAAAAIGYPAGAKWDPFGWIDFWESARRKPDSVEYRLALEIQRLEWEILFEYCARSV